MSSTKSTQTTLPSVECSATTATIPSTDTPKVERATAIDTKAIAVSTTVEMHPTISDVKDVSAKEEVQKDIGALANDYAVDGDKGSLKGEEENMVIIQPSTPTNSYTPWSPLSPTTFQNAPPPTPADTLSKTEKEKKQAESLAIAVSKLKLGLTDDSEGSEDDEKEYETADEVA